MATVTERSPPPSCMRMTEPRNCGLVFMVFNWSSTNWVISSGRLALALIPVVGVDLVSDDGEAELLDAHDGRSLVVGLGLFVNVVRWTEVERLHAEFAGEETFRELYLEVEAVGEMEFSLMSGWK